MTKLKALKHLSALTNDDRVRGSLGGTYWE